MVHNGAVSTATCKKLEGHLWYLSEQLVGLAFFNPDVSLGLNKKQHGSIFEN